MRALSSNLVSPAPAPDSGSLLALLARASRIDGPVRLFAPRRGPSDAGLLPPVRRSRELVQQLVGALATELPRPSNQPRQVVLTDEGLHFLLRHLTATDRAARVREASPLYQARLLRAWKELAAPAEQELVERTVKELFGDLVDSGADAARAYELARAKELVLSYRRTTHPEARESLARVMASLGLRAIGTPGEEVVFDARRHVCAESLFPGDPVEILEPGWILVSPSGDSLLDKATVHPLPP